MPRACCRQRVAIVVLYSDYDRGEKQIFISEVFDVLDDLSLEKQTLPVNTLFRNG